MTDAYVRWPELRAAADRLAGPPTQDLTALQKEVEQAKVSPMTFGVIGQVFVSGAYDQAVAYHTKNLTEGVTAIGAIADGLRKCATHWETADNSWKPST